MIEIYFVRHGQTEGNLAGRHQSDLTRLTTAGKEQAKVVGEALKKLKPTHFMTSTHLRAVETARVMEEILDLTPTTNQLFQEVVRPAYMSGHYHRSFKTVVYLIRWYLNRLPDNGEAKAGESYRMFRRRLLDAKLYLSNLPDSSRVVVVSHSVFITLFLAHMCQEDKLSLPRAFRTLVKLFLLPNAGVVKVCFAPEFVNQECPWRIPRI